MAMISIDCRSVGVGVVSWPSQYGWRALKSPIPSMLSLLFKLSFQGIESCVAVIWLVLWVDYVDRKRQHSVRGAGLGGHDSFQGMFSLA